MCLLGMRSRGWRELNPRLISRVAVLDLHLFGHHSLRAVTHWGSKQEDLATLQITGLKGLDWQEDEFQDWSRSSVYRQEDAEETKDEQIFYNLEQTPDGRPPQSQRCGGETSAADASE
ncbi:hypothetical protein SRHO_G00266240 [Serrasalmus rhombeus]